jgi:hypothetical protein
MVDLTTTPDSVLNWATTRFQQQCAAVFDTYMPCATWTSRPTAATS